MLKIKLIAIFGLIMIANSGAAPVQGERPAENDLSLDIVPPNTMNCVHKYGNVHMCVSNWGFFGSQGGGETDCETNEPAPSMEFPAGSGIEHLFQGALWIGAIVGDDTLVSVGADGWQLANELYPCGDIGYQHCWLERGSNRPADPYYDPLAVSDLEYTGYYSDTLVDPSYTPDDWTGRPYIPLGIEIEQHSYSWSAEGKDQFVIFEFEVSSIGGAEIDEAYVGISVDADIMHISDNFGYTDDISGSGEFDLGTAFYSQMMYGWATDNDGDPVGGAFDFTSPRSAIGVAFLGPWTQQGTVDFNWWVSNGNPSLDWGPWLTTNAGIFDFLTGGLGTPEGDRSKWFLLQNGESDYDQLETAIDHSPDGWLPPPPNAASLAAGSDTRFFLSHGPLSISPGLPARFGAVFAVGDNVHVNPTDFATLFDPFDPGPFQESLDFSDLENTLAAARRMYDRINMGDVTWDGITDIDDIVRLIGYVYLAGPEPAYLPVCDVNCDGVVNLLDITLIVNYIFRGGDLPGGGCLD
jgi:hypothetical protein